MKKNILIIVFLISTIKIYAQHYKFNLVTTYKSENGFYKEKTVFSNKENGSYFLTIREFENQKTAYLDDLKSSYQHQFKIIENTIDGKETTTNFIYLNSQKIKKEETSAATREFKVVQRDSLSKTVNIINYKNEHKKKIIGTATLIIKDSSFNLFPVFRYSCLHPYERFYEFNFNENGIVESYKSLYKNEPIFIYLDYFKDLKEFELKVEI